MGHRRIILTAVFSSVLAFLITLMSFMPQTAYAHVIDQETQRHETAASSPQVIQESASPSSEESTSAEEPIKLDLQSLLDAATDQKDKDKDGLPDSVESVLGTDPDNADTDFDTLDDYYEAANGLDPLKADSNDDGLVDNLEIKDVAVDFDGDGTPNVWDDDNDNDGVRDGLDNSPFSSTDTGDTFHFDIQTNGNPTYADFQIKPEDAEHLKLSSAAWDWPSDTEGQMQDRDNSTEDVQLYPTLEMEMDSSVDRSAVADYNIVVPEDPENAAGFEVRGITSGWVDNYDYYTKDEDCDLILFGADNSTGTNSNGYIIGWDYGTTDPIAPVRWNSLKKVESDTTSTYSGAGAAVDLDDIFTSTDQPEIIIPRIGGDSIYQSPIYFGVDQDNYGNPTYENESASFAYTGSPLYAVGSGLDVADINEDGKNDLLAVFLIQDTGELACLIGWDLSKNTGLFRDYIMVSAWSYSEPLQITGVTEGTLKGQVEAIPSFGSAVTNISVKIANINGSGTPDLVLMGTDSGGSKLYYRIGWDLDADGIPTSWSEIMTSNNIGIGKAGGGVAATDLNGNGTPDLLLMAVDNAENHDYHYIIGWDIDSSGSPVSWSDDKDYSDTYNGFVTRGITVADINGTGDPELVLLGSDDDADPDRPGYMIGWDFTDSDFLSTASAWSPAKTRSFESGSSDYWGTAAFTDVDDNGQLEMYIPRIGGKNLYEGSCLYIANLDGHGDEQAKQGTTYYNYEWSLFGHSGSDLYAESSALDIADIDGNGVPDILVTFLIKGTNQLAYVIGWNLSDKEVTTSTGTSYSWVAYGWPASWSYSPPLQITQGYLSEAQGTLSAIPAFDNTDIANISVKIADIEGDGNLDLLLMGTDSGGSELYYRIGWDIGADGNPTSWSGTITSDEIDPGAAGGGAAAVDLNHNGILDLLLMAVDNAEDHNYHYSIGWDIDHSGNPETWSRVYNKNPGGANRVYVPLTAVVDAGNNVAFSGRMFFPAGYNEDVSLDARLVWIATGKTDAEDGTSATTQLAQYRENFKLTGFSVTENYGTDGGLFYSDSRDQTIAAGFVLAYDFLRTQALLEDIPGLMKKHGLSKDGKIMSSNILSFPHQDAALVALTSDMTEEALKGLPDGQVLPILLAMESRFTSVDLSQMTSAGETNSFSTDLRAVPVTTAKMFRMNWYNTTTGDLVREDILTEMQQWGLAQDVLENVMKIVLAWEAGDFTITRIGTDTVTFDMPEQNIVMNSLGSVFDYGLAAVDLTRSIYGIYRYLTRIPSEVSGAESGFFAGIINACEDVEAVRIGTLGNINAAVRWAGFIGDLLAAGVAVYSFFDVACKYQWSDVGVTLGIWYFDFYFAYGLALIMIGAIPVFGWLADLGIIISDALGGWFSDFMDWFIGLFYETKPYTAIDIGIEGSAFSFDDYDDNGLDAGDRVDLTLDLVEKAYTTSDNPWGVFSFSNPNLTTYIDADVACSGGNVSDQNDERIALDYNGDFVTSNYTDPNSYNYSYDNQLFENHFWAVTDQSGINLPWQVWLNYSYQIVYEESFMGAKDPLKAKTGSGSSDPFIVYLDVMPGSLESLLAWNAITRLDPDGDNLVTGDPDNNSYDSDGDGLSDGFEVRSGFNPNNSDTDSDGLSDLMEVRLDTDPADADTDSDGLNDGTEYYGWDITFAYCGHEFISHVSSDPLFKDTDSDGVTDYDEYQGPLCDCAQGNPRSQDTNGNGIKDQLDVKPVIVIDTQADVTEGETFILSGHFIDTDKDTWTATVDYGDGSGQKTLNLNKDKTFTLDHIFPLIPTGTLIEEHPYSCSYDVTLKVTDDKGGVGSAVVKVTWYNFVPEVELGHNAAVTAGGQFTRTAHWIDPGLNDNVTVEVDWGDGSSEQLPDNTAYFDRTSRAIYLGHTYDDTGTYTLQVSVTDDFGDTGTASLQVEVVTFRVKIDIKPGSDVNAINPGSDGVIPVAILTDTDFDAGTADADTLCFGPGHAAPVHQSMEDVDGDGDVDMLLHFSTPEAGLSEQDTEAYLTGVTLEGMSFSGVDTVTIVSTGENNGSNGKADAPGQKKGPGEPADGKGKDNAPGQNKDSADSTADNAGDRTTGKDAAPGQSKDSAESSADASGESADGKAVGKDNAPGQNKDAAESSGDSITSDGSDQVNASAGDTSGKENAPGQNKEPGDNANGKAAGLSNQMETVAIVDTETNGIEEAPGQNKE